MVQVEELFKQVLASLNEDLYEMNHEHQADIDNGVKPQKSKQDKLPAKARERIPRQFPKKKLKSSHKWQSRTFSQSVLA